MSATNNNTVDISAKKDEVNTPVTPSIFDTISGANQKPVEEELDADMIAARSKKRKIKFYDELDKLISRLCDALSESRGVSLGKEKQEKNQIDIGIKMFKEMLKMRHEDPDVDADITSDLYAVFDMIYDDYKPAIMSEKQDEIGMWLINNKVVARYGTGRGSEPSKIALYISFVYVISVQRCTNKKQELDLKKVPKEDYANYIELIRPYTILLHLYRIFSLINPKDNNIIHIITVIEVFLGIKDARVLEVKAPQPNFMGDMLGNAMKEFGINVDLGDIQNQLKSVMADPETKNEFAELANSFSKDDIGTIFNSMMGDMKSGKTSEPAEPTESQKRLMDKASKMFQNKKLRGVFDTFVGGIENEELKSYINNDTLTAEFDKLANPNAGESSVGADKTHVSSDLNE